MTATPLALFAPGERPAWLDPQAPTPVCSQTDPDPIDRTSEASGRVAKWLCASCPLLHPCRAYALAHPKETRFGIWGGLSEHERRALRRRLRRQQRMAAVASGEVAA